MYVPQLVIRIYQQTADHGPKSLCLNRVGGMLALDIPFVEKKLEKVQR